ncbi:permease-like cell division protein FtsX [Psychromicrobium xiongbiense]|uniref:permease-like cell division protein FtsX n=1 Tax=Psychromicrobium xiongbiense TaxID=3051184 RepID=UPI00255608D0|nr:permease-like cell division protein FtsX [Psychromicrobium sp. YIM S02556]
MRVGFILGEIGSGLRRNLSMVISVVLVTCVSLAFVGAALMLQTQITNMKGYWYDKIQVSIFLCGKDSVAPTCNGQPVTDAQKQNIQALLNSPAIKPYVKSVTFETQQEALVHIKDQMKDSPIVDSFTVDQMPSSFRIGLADPEKFPIFKEAFSSVDGVDQVVDMRQLLEGLFKWMNVGTAAAGIVAVLMTVAAFLLVATTIRLSAFSRRRETGIMRLVGASKTVVQLPFILEGVISAVIGALLAILGLWLVVVLLVQGNLQPASPLTPYITVEQVWWVAPVLLAISVVVAGLSSWLTLRRWVKV